MRTGLLLPLVLCLGVSLQAEEPPQFRCSQTDLTGYERDGKVRIHVERVSGLETPGTGRIVIFPESGGRVITATHELPFAPGVTSQSWDWPVQDSYYNGPRKFYVFCGGYTGNVPPDIFDTGPSFFWLTLYDDEPFPAVTSIEPSSIEENGGQRTLQFGIKPAFANDTLLYVRSADGTAIEGVDYYSLYTPVYAWAGTSKLQLLVTPINDSVAEEDERFRLQVTTTDLDAIGGFDVTIVDDDRPPYVFTLDRLRYDAAEGAPLSITVQRQADPPGLPGTAVLHFSSPDHLPWPADVPVHFSGSETSRTVQVSLDDSWYTGDRSGTVSVSIFGFTTDMAELTVTEDDPFPVLSVSDAQVREGAAGETAHVDLHFALSHPAGLDVHFEVATADGTATAGDYTPLRKPLFFPPGTTSLTAHVDVTGDGAVEPDETFTLSIGKCCGTAAKTGRRTATVTILDDDAPDGDGGPGDGGEYRFEEPFAGDWSEDAKWLTATVVRRNTAAPGRVTVQLLLDEARTFWPIVLRFQPNESEKTVRFFIDDSYYSGNASGRLELLDGSTVDDQRAVRVADNERRPVVSVGDIEVTEGEDDRPSAFIVRVDPPSFLPIEVTAICHLDRMSEDVLIPVQTPLVIPSLATSASVPFKVAGDDLVEDDETFWISLWFLKESHAVIAPNFSGVCTIRDDDRRHARLSFLSDRVLRGGSAVARLILGEPATTATTIHLTGEGVSVPATVEVAAGATRVEFPVTGADLGEGLVRVELPGGARLEERLLVYTDGALSVPPPIRMNRGRAIDVPLQLAAVEGRPFTVSITSSDARIAAPPMFAEVPGAFPLYGVANGQATLTITLPPELGGASFTLPAEVVDPVSKRRSLR